METSVNLLRGIRAPALGAIFIGTPVILHLFAPGGERKLELVEIRHFNPTRRLPWTVRIYNCGRVYSCQADDIAQDFYITSVRLVHDSPLAKIRDTVAAIPFVGMKVCMWESGWRPGQKHDQEFEIIEYSPMRARQEEGSSDFPWWCAPLPVTTGNRNTQWYAQAARIEKGFYIAPASLFGDVGDAKTPAESLSRIFLGG